MSDHDKQKVLRYAELALKKERSGISDVEKVELDGIRKRLNLPHEAILEMAVKKLFPED